MKLRLRNPFNELYSECNASEELTRSLNLIIAAAAIGLVFFAQSQGASMTGLATALGANDFVFGLLWALPVLASMSQFLASSLVDKTGRHKKIFLIGGVIQRSVWLIVAWLPYIIPEELANSRIWFMIVLVTASSVAGSFTNAGFYAFFSNLVPMEIRGRYISARSRICTVTSMLSGFAAAWVLDSLPGFIGYTIVFTVASFFGVADILVFFWVDVPPMKKSEKKGGFAEVLNIIRRDKYIRNFILFWGVWTFSVNIASPFFTRYALDVQGLTFMQVILFGQIPANVLSIVFLGLWGKMLDRYGSKPVLLVTCVFTAVFVSVWFPAVKGSIASILLFNVLGGIVWCGTDITSQNMLLSHTPQEGRNMVIALYFVVNALCSAFAFTLGGAILEYTKPLFAQWNLKIFFIPIDHYKLLFLITIFLRLIPPLLILPRVWSEKPFENTAVYKAMWGGIVRTVKKLTARKIKN